MKQLEEQLLSHVGAGEERVEGGKQEQRIGCLETSRHFDAPR